MRGNTEQAIKSYKEALKRDPTFLAGWEYLNYAYKETGEYYKAIEACNKALKIDPGFQLAKNKAMAISLMKK